MKFSVFTASLPDWTPEHAVQRLAQLGWDGVEWRVVDQKPAEGVGFWQGNNCTWPESSFVTDAPRIRQLTEQAGLEVSAVGAYASSDRVDAVDQLMTGAVAIGASRIRVTVGKPGEDEGYQAAFARRREEYGTIQELARKHGVQALVELHHQSLIASASAAARFLQGFDPRYVGAIHDIGNMLQEGYEYDPWSLEILGEYLAHVHVKNAKPVPKPTEGRTDWTWTWAPMRHGVGNLPRLFRSLAQVGYDGWVAVEDFSTEVPLDERVADNLAYLKELTS